MDEQIIATLPVRFSTPIDGHICLKNLGRKSVALIGTNEPRSLTLARTTVNGKRSAGDARATLLILTAADRSPGGSFGELSRHLSTLSGGITPVWIIWILAILLVVGVPVAALLALALALRPAR